ncbi:MAG TPA: GAF domain-containing protein [Anaerolineales bacterium]|nr:GAF domain-containing protein [Anaerolineales bacterium]
MLKIFRRFFAAPVFAEAEDVTRRASILNVIGWSVIAVLLTLLIVRNLVPETPVRNSVNLIFAIIILVTALTLYISRLGYVRAASLIMISIGWIGLSSFAWAAEGIRDVAILGYFIPILMAGLLLGWQGAAGFTVVSILAGWFFAYAETSGLLVPVLGTPLNFARDLTGILVLAGVLMYVMINNLQRALDSSRSTAGDLAISNRELHVLKEELEQRVEARTSELTQRARQLEAVSSVAHTVASFQDLDTLLPAVTELVSQRFGFYEAGIFLLDEKQNRAILRASSSESGRRLVKQNFGLTPDQHSIVGYSIFQGEPRVSLDVATDSVYLDNPNLPETRSEVALPLRVAGRVIGVLDVQSTEVNAFSKEDIGVLATLADQVAIAIENARLFSEARSALSESRTMFEKYTQHEWSNFARQAKQTGFVFDGKQVVPLDRTLKRDSIREVLQTGNLTMEKESAAIAIPIKVRGQTIGVLDIRSQKGQRVWRQDEINMLQAAAERAALALENARLVESAQRGAARERAIGDISTRIGSVSNFESILQTAVEELGRKLGGATEVTLEINHDDSSGGRA